MDNTGSHDPDHHLHHHHHHQNFSHIPVMGVPLVSDSPLYLLRWFYSIDTPVQHIVVVSGGNNVFVKAEIAHIADQVRKQGFVEFATTLGCV